MIFNWRLTFDYSDDLTAYTILQANATDLPVHVRDIRVGVPITMFTRGAEEHPVIDTIFHCIYGLREERVNDVILEFQL